jgi:multidrug efflux pump
LRVQSNVGLVPIGNFVKRTAKHAVGVINRVDGNRVLNVRANVGPGVLADSKLQEIRAWLHTAGLDPRINVTYRGQDQEQQEAGQFLMKAFVIALFLMAGILLTQFNSFYSSFVILTAVIMSTIGVLIGLLITNQPFGIVMSGIGVIALAGIVVNHNIILIGTSDRMLKAAHSQREAILRTCAQRVRPVMLTTITGILGLLPMVFRVNIDFATREITYGAPSTQWWTQLSAAIVFGLAFATVLTLIVTPSALMLKANVAAWRLRRRDRGERQAADAAETGVVPAIPERRAAE